MTNEPLVFRFNFEPISINKLFVNIPGQARRFKSPEGKKFSADIRAVIDQMSLMPYISALHGKKLEVSITVGLNSWFLKDGKTIRKRDVDNLSKALLDNVFACLEGLDDSQIWNLHMYKKATADPEILMSVTAIP